MRESGKPFGNYTLLERLARGGMAEVFLAQQQGPQGFDRLVALKRILPHLMDSEDFVRMFHDEARLAARLSHPNVVHIYEFGKVDEHHFIAMEFVDGVHSGEIIERGAADPMPPALVARVAADACAGLNHAHRLTDNAGNPLHLVHRDISPPNLMISYEGVVKLVDFGIAKAVDMAGKTMPGIVKGKYAYMSPEQTMGKKLDGRSDVFSLGMVIWEMLAGRVALDRTDPVEAMRCIRDGRLPNIRTVRRDIPPALADVLDMALTNKPAERPSAAELGNAFEGFLKSWPELATSMQLAEWIEQRFPRRTSEQRDTMATPVPGVVSSSPSGPASNAQDFQSGFLNPEHTPNPAHTPGGAAASFDFLHDAGDEATQQANISVSHDLLPRAHSGQVGNVTSPAQGMPAPGMAPHGHVSHSTMPGTIPPGTMPGTVGAPGQLFHDADSMPHGTFPGLGAGGTRRRVSRRAMIIGGALLLALIIGVMMFSGGSNEGGEASNTIAAGEAADAGETGTAPTQTADAGPDGVIEPPSTSEDAGAGSDGDEGSARLVVETDPPGASASLDGGEPADTPATFDGLQAGTHTLAIERSGYEDVEEELELEPGENKRSYELDKVRKRRGKGKLNVLTRPSCTAYLGKKKLGKTPFAGKKVRAGSYTLECKKSGYRTGTERVRVRAGQTTKVTMTLKKR